MGTIKIAVLCPSEIAFRRFMPALEKFEGFEYAGIAVATAEERVCVLGAQSERVSDCEPNAIAEQKEFAQRFQDSFGGDIFKSFEALLTSDDIQAVYIPLPPALHYFWAKKAIEQGKHVLLEKPFTSAYDTTIDLLDCALEFNVAVHENYMFSFHSQIQFLLDCLDSGRLGKIRDIRIDFGFPFRGSNDFRYSKALGGGALLDCGGYTLKLASMLLGPTARIQSAHLNYEVEFEVDVFGGACLENDEGLSAQLSFGMDNDYRCSVDVWGSKASLRSGRILTAPVDFEPTMTISDNGEETVVKLPSDDSFLKSIEHFADCIKDHSTRRTNMDGIRTQARLVQDVLEAARRS